MHLSNFCHKIQVLCKLDPIILFTGSLEDYPCIETDETCAISTAKKLKEEFIELVEFVYSCLSAVRDVGLLKLRLNLFLNFERQNTPAVLQHLLQLQSIPTADAILNYLIATDFIGYLNYELLTVFQKVSKSDILQSKIQQYELQHDAFLKNTNFNTIVNIFKRYPELAPASPIGLPKLNVRFKSPWEGRSFYSWKEVIERRSYWPPFAMIASISRNSVILTFAVFPSFVPAVVRDLTDQKVLALLEREGLSVELSSDLLQLQDDMEAEISEDETIEDQLPIGVENLKLSTDDKNVSVSKRSETELTSFGEEDGEGKESYDDEVVKAKTISILEQV